MFSIREASVLELRKDMQEREEDEISEGQEKEISDKTHISLCFFD